jgi:hypothetical protein
MQDKLIGKMFNRKEQKGSEEFKKDGKAINEKVRLYAQVGVTVPKKEITR